MKTKVFALYNNKGGVSKTTTTFNVAVYLSEPNNALKKSAKVLLIDADSQANITELFFASDPKFWDSSSDELPGDSILDVLKPRLEGSASRVDVSKVDLLVNKKYKNLYLLRGDINFSALAEGYFSSSVEQAITSNVNQKNTYLCLRRLVKDLIDEHKFDYVIFDLGPSTGAISRLALLACDGYFVPVTPDRFSALAVKSLPLVIAEWFKHDKLILSTMAPYGLESDYKEPVFYGAISQQFQVHKGKIKKSYERWAEKIESQLRLGFLENKDIPSKTLPNNSPIVARIENLGPVVPVAQMVGKAIFDISQEDTKFASSDGQMYYGAVFDPWLEKMKQYKGEMAKLADALK